MGSIRLLHHGAAEGVTGSCHQLFLDADNSVLVDCGLFQGADVSNLGASEHNQTIDFSIEGVRALIITHVHADHVGRIPYLLAAGFKGPILCSIPSAKLLPIVLEDAFKLVFSRDQQQVERYIAEVQRRIIALPYATWFTLQDKPGLLARVRLQRAAHILGSAYVEIDLDGKQEKDSIRVVFSGDLGAPDAPILKACRVPERADLLVLESTYGDRLHENRSRRRERLEQVVEHALADNGTVLIPAFSLGRTQELLYELEDIIHSRQLDQHTVADAVADHSTGLSWPHLPVILDSPLARRLTRAYRELRDFWNEEAHERVQSGRRPLAFEQLITVDSHTDHQKILEHLTRSARPAIVIAGSGMCTSGRIVNYLKAMLGDPRHDVLFVGYQAHGTPGRAIQRFGPGKGYVELDGKRHDIRAGVHSIDGYSAHADQAGLVSFVTGMRKWPGEIRLVHGEPQARRSLGEVLARLYDEAQRPVVIINSGA